MPTKNFVKKVEKVDIFKCCEDSFFDSSAKCVPKASESASAIAIDIIEPITAKLECVPKYTPTIKPNVVTTPEAIPKPKPLLKPFEKFFKIFIIKYFKN